MMEQRPSRSINGADWVGRRGQLLFLGNISLRSRMAWPFPKHREQRALCSTSNERFRLCEADAAHSRNEGQAF